MIKIKKGESIFYNFSESSYSEDFVNFEGKWEIRLKTDDSLIVDGDLIPEIKTPTTGENCTLPGNQLLMRISYTVTETIDVGKDYVLIAHVSNPNTGFKDYILIEDLIIEKIY